MPRGAFAAYALPAEDVCIVDHKFDDHYRWQHRRGHRGQHTSFSYGAAPPPAYGAPPPAQGAPPPAQQQQQGGSSEKKDDDDKEKKNDGSTITWKAKDGEEYEMPKESVDKCITECKNEPWKKRAEEKAAAPGAAAMGAMNMVGGVGPRELQGECVRFCQAEAGGLKCFPGSSTVVVRNRGREKICDLRPGDLVLSSRRTSRAGACSKEGGEADGWELFYDTVLTFLDYLPDGQSDVIHIRHALGGLHLTPDHLVFVHRARQSNDAGSPTELVALRAQEVQPGDHVLAPWIDGCVSEAEVLEVETVWTDAGLFAPLTASGMLLVDGTLASCYALPESLHRVPAFQCLFETIGSHCIQETIHSLFLPLRLSLKSVEIMASRAGAAAAKATTALAVVRSATVPSASLEALEVPTKNAAEPCWSKEDAPIHPYPWFIYVLVASVVA